MSIQRYYFICVCSSGVNDVHDGPLILSCLWKIDHFFLHHHTFHVHFHGVVKRSNYSLVAASFVATILVMYCVMDEFKKKSVLDYVQQKQKTKQKVFRIV